MMRKTRPDPVPAWVAFGFPVIVVAFVIAVLWYGAYVLLGGGNG